MGMGRSKLVITGIGKGTGYINKHMVSNMTGTYRLKLCHGSKIREIFYLYLDVTGTGNNSIRTSEYGSP